MRLQVSRADQQTGATVGTDGLSHCCSAPNPLHQIQTHTQTHTVIYTKTQHQHLDSTTVPISLRHRHINLSEGSASCGGREGKRFWRADGDKAGMLIHCCCFCFI